MVRAASGLEKQKLWHPEMFLTMFKPRFHEHMTLEMGNERSTYLPGEIPRKIDQHFKGQNVC
jgi:hypothetical protein